MGLWSDETYTVKNTTKNITEFNPETNISIPLDKLAKSIKDSAIISSEDAKKNREAAIAATSANLDFNKSLEKAKINQATALKKEELNQANEIKKVEIDQANAKLALNSKIKSAELEQKNKIYTSSVLISLVFFVSYLYTKNKKKVKK